MTNSIDESFLDETILEEAGDRKGWILQFAIFYLFWVAQPLILWSLGACEFQKGQILSLLSVFIRFLFFGAGLHVVLIGPLIYFAYPDLKKIETKVLRELALFVVLALPILSFGYFISQINHVGDFYELLFPTVSLILISVLLFETTQSLTLLSLGLSTSLYLQWFGSSDILGPFKTAYQMVPSSDLFYWAKSSWIVLVLGWAIWKTDRLDKGAVQERNKNRIVTFLVWMFVGSLLYFGLPWIVSYYEKEAHLSLSVFDFLFCSIPIVALVELNPRIATSKLGQGFKIVLGILFLLRALFLVLSQEATLVFMSWAAYDFISVVLLALSLPQRHRV